MNEVDQCVSELVRSLVFPIGVDEEWEEEVEGWRSVEEIVEKSMPRLPSRKLMDANLDEIFRVYRL